MGEQVNASAWNRNAAGNSLDRLTLTEFSNLVHPYVRAIASRKDDLSTIRALFTSGERIWDSDCEDAIECLVGVRHDCREFHTCIERSDHFPLAVVSLRLPLLSVLEDVEAQIIELNRLIVSLCHDSQTALDQSVQQVFEIENKMDLLELKRKEVLGQVSILLDRARFKEREYNMV